MVWDYRKVAQITEVNPLAAHRLAMFAAANAAADAVRGRASGALARDVRLPKPVGPLSALIGSSLVYARIQDQGGVIRAKSEDKRLVVRGGLRSALGQYQRQEILARPMEVTMPAKHYLLWVAPTYEMTLIANLRRMFPR